MLEAGVGCVPGSSNSPGLKSGGSSGFGAGLARSELAVASAWFQTTFTLSTHAFHACRAARCCTRRAPLDLRDTVVILCNVCVSSLDRWGLLLFARSASASLSLGALTRFRYMRMQLRLHLAPRMWPCTENCSLSAAACFGLRLLVWLANGCQGELCSRTSILVSQRKVSRATRNGSR